MGAVEISIGSGPKSNHEKYYHKYSDYVYPDQKDSVWYVATRKKN